MRIRKRLSDSHNACNTNTNASGKHACCHRACDTTTIHMSVPCKGSGCANEATMRLPLQARFSTVHWKGQSGRQNERPQWDDERQEQEHEVRARRREPDEDAKAHATCALVQRQRATVTVTVTVVLIHACLLAPVPAPAAAVFPCTAAAYSCMLRILLLFH